LTAPRIDGRIAVVAIALLAASLLLAGCSAVTLPHDTTLAERSTERRVVVLVPGITGVELVDPDSGKIVWGRGANLIVPRDRGYRLALPFADLEAPRDGVALRPGRALRRLRLGPIVKPVYGPIVDLLEAHGWRTGDLDDPAATDDLFLFAYDWRRDNRLSARQLADALEIVAQRRGGGDPSITLICQSNGAHICRYLVKYGKAMLAEARRGKAEPAGTVRIEQLVLIGNANGGSMRILSFFNQGRRYAPGIGRKFSPEVFFTFESLYQDLPAYRTDLFVDPTGRPLDVDLYDPESWRRYGWSIYGKKTARRLARTDRTDLFGNARQRDDHLARQLADAHRFQRELERDLPVGPTRYYLIQNRALPTPDRAVLNPTANGWQTLVTGDRPLARLEVSADVASNGDGHATGPSQLWLSPTEIEAFGDEPYYVDGPHFEMILEFPALERLLAILGAQPSLAAR